MVAAVGSGPELLPALLEHRPDAAVLDARMPPHLRDEGPRAAREARERIPVLVLSQCVEESYAAEPLQDGDAGPDYLLKDRVGRAGELLDALERVAAGGTALDPEVVGELRTRRRDTPLDSLTPREREVLAPMAGGDDNATGARMLVVTERAVSKDLGNVFPTLGLPAGDSGHHGVLAVPADLNNPRA